MASQQGLIESFHRNIDISIREASGTNITYITVTTITEEISMSGSPSRRAVR